MCNFNFGPNSGYNLQFGKAKVPYLIQKLWQDGFGCVSARQTHSSYVPQVPTTPTPVMLPTISPASPFDVSFHGQSKSVVTAVSETLFVS